MKDLPELTVWLDENLKEIQRVQELLSTPLSNNPVLICEQLSGIESWGSRMIELLAAANRYLDEAEYRELSKIDKDKRALEREVELAYAVVKERWLRDRLEGITKSISSKLILGQSLIKSQARETNLHTIR